ncbi:MAG: class I SAM-dependent methyltransferase [Trebonia sp.]
MSGHDHGPEMFDAAFWDARYSSAHALWSGNPNHHLVAEVGGPAGLAPGTALDAGAGEGADAIWLAERGWQVTAVDISGVALGRAAEHAAKAGDEVVARIRLLREDLIKWTPPGHAYDLVTSQYIHLPGALRHTFFARLAAAVRDGGTLLIVGHHPMDLDTTLQRPNHPELLFTGDELASEIGGDGWEIVTNVTAERATTDPDGRPVTAHDTVFRARRV